MSEYIAYMAADCINHLRNFNGLFYNMALIMFLLCFVSTYDIFLCRLSKNNSAILSFLTNLLNVDLSVTMAAENLYWNLL